MNMLLSLILMNIIEEVTGPIGETFMDLFGSELILGVFLFMIILIFTFIFGLGMIVGSVVLIPAMFLVFKYIPSGRIILAIMLGLLFGMALNRLIRR